MKAAKNVYGVKDKVSLYHRTIINGKRNFVRIPIIPRIRQDQLAPKTWIRKFWSKLLDIGSCWIVTHVTKIFLTSVCILEYACSVIVILVRKWTRVQILIEIVCILNDSNTLRKGMNRVISLKKLINCWAD